MQPPTHQTVTLTAGRHRAPQAGMCVMELASVLAGDRFTDRPRSVSRSIAGLLRGYNDGLDASRRQSLKRLAADCVGTTADRAVERHRRELIRTSLPAGDVGRLGLRLGVVDRIIRAHPYEAGHNVGILVARTGDDGLHARVMAFVDELIGVTRSGAADLDVEVADAGALARA